MRNLQNSRFYWRKCCNKVMLGLAHVAVVFGLFWLCWILFSLISRGIPALSLDLFVQETPATNEKGGLMNAIVGSFLVVGTGTLIGTPIGVLAGTYLAEYGHYSRFAKVTRFFK